MKSVNSLFLKDCQSWHEYCSKEIEILLSAATYGRMSLQKRKESIMKSKIFENGLALLGALVIIIGVSAAASTALAGDIGTVEIHGSAHN